MNFNYLYCGKLSLTWWSDAFIDLMCGSRKVRVVQESPVEGGFLQDDLRDVCAPKLVSVKTAARKSVSLIFPSESRQT